MLLASRRHRGTDRPAVDNVTGESWLCKYKFSDMVKTAVPTQLEETRSC